MMRAGLVRCLDTIYYIYKHAVAGRECKEVRK